LNYGKLAPQILNASTNLLGICLSILTTLEFAKFQNHSYLNELAACAILYLVSSCILPFLAIKTVKEKFSGKLENIADVLFFRRIALYYLSYLHRKYR